MILAEEIASDLMVNTTLKHLNLSDMVVLDIAEPLAKMLKVNTALQTVDLSGLAFDDDCATKLGKMLSVNSTLLEMDLGRQFCSASGAFIGYTLSHVLLYLHLLYMILNSNRP